MIGPERYTKVPLSFDEQADLLLRRGLQADRATLLVRLHAVNYYRLSGYLFPFRQPDETFRPGTTLDLVWRRYVFDRRLRTLLLDALERIEVAVRTQAVQAFVVRYGCFGYADAANLPGLSISTYLEWRGHLVEETERAKSEQFVKHFRTKYGMAHPELPFWMLCELMSFGSLVTFLRGVAPDLQQVIAAQFNLPDQLFLSWLKALYAIRNTCAHHSRVWNRELGVKPLLPAKNKHPAWHEQPEIPNARVGVLLTICHSWLRTVASTSNWRSRLFALFDEFPEIPHQQMGLPDTWREHPLWQSRAPSPGASAT